MLIEHGVRPHVSLVIAIREMIDDAFSEGMDVEYGAWVAKVGLEWLEKGESGADDN